MILDVCEDSEIVPKFGTTARLGGSHFRSRTQNQRSVLGVGQYVLTKKLRFGGTRIRRFGCKGENQNLMNIESHYKRSKLKKVSKILNEVDLRIIIN